MGCCGCSLSTSAIVAAVFGILESIGGLCGSIFLLQNGSGGYSYSLTIQSEGSISVNSGIYIVNEFSAVIVSTLIINSIWLLATILLILGIIKQSPALHQLWVWVTSIVMICDIAQTITIVTVFIREERSYTVGQGHGDIAVTFIVLLALATRGTVVFWIVNICLTIYTAHRATEIRIGPQPTTQVIVFGGQPTHYAYPGQEMSAHQPGGSSGFAPPTYDFHSGEFENKVYRPDVPKFVQGGGIHPDQR